MHKYFEHLDAKPLVKITVEASAIPVEEKATFLIGIRGTIDRPGMKRQHITEVLPFSMLVDAGILERIWKRIGDTLRESAQEREDAAGQQIMRPEGDTD